MCRERPLPHLNVRFGSQILSPISKQEFLILKTVTKSLRGFIFLILDQILPMILSANHFNLIPSLKQEQASLPHFGKMRKQRIFSPSLKITADHSV